MVGSSDERRGREPQRWQVAAAEDIPPGERLIVDVKGHSIGVFNVHGTFVAVLNMCPHELAPVCRGRLGGTTLRSRPGEYRWGRDGEILACPWHGWEYDLTTGEMLADQRIRLKRYPVEVKDGVVFITL
jgi:nitrite reductase/ring-hydroxylating ferredoxin subunit